MLFSLNNNGEKFIKNFFNKVNSFNNLKTKINDAIEEKTKKIQSYNFESKLKGFILEESSNSDVFGTVLNLFIDNSSTITRSKNIKSINKFKSYEKLQTNIDFNNNLNKFVKKHCLFSASNESSLSNIRSVINDVNVQNLVTMIRNLYFMSPNTYEETSNNNFLDIDKENLRVYTSELSDLNFFQFINNNDLVDLDRLLATEFFSNIENNSLSSTRGTNLLLSNTVQELEGKQYLNPSITQYIDQTMISNLKNANHIKGEDFNRESLFAGSFLISNTSNSSTMSNEINKFFTGKFFNINILNFTSIKNQGLSDLVGFMFFENTQNNSGSEANILFKENFLNKRNDEIIYKFSNSITSYEDLPSSRFRKGKIRATDRVLLDDPSVHNFNDVYTKTIVDSFVKRNKINLLKSNNVNMEPINEIISNIKNTSVQNKMIPYCRSDRENISVLNGESQFFNLFFTEGDEDNTYFSHVDIVTDHSVDDSRFLGLDQMLLEEVVSNEDKNLISDEVKKIISIYYPNNNFFSSSLFFKNILESIVNESKIVETENYCDYNLTQALYFNYFKDNIDKDSEVKSIVAERFLKKAIQLDNVSSFSFRKSKKLNSFKYKFEEIIEEDFNKDSIESIKDYINSVLKTSKKLDKIKKSLFSKQNIENLKLVSDFRRVSNLSIVNSGYSSDLDESQWDVSAIINYNVLPNYCMLYNFKSSNDFANDGVITYNIQQKNNILKETKFGEINAETGEREVEKIEYKVDRSTGGFDVTKSNDILVKLTPILCKSDKNRENKDFPSIVIKDFFDEIFESTNLQSFCFGKIIEVIQDMLRMNILDYNNKTFNNEEEIDTLIAENKSLISEVINLIEIYAKFYLIYTARIQRHQSLKIFQWQKKEINNSTYVGGTNAAFNANGIISRHDNVYSSFKEVMNLNFSDRVSILSSLECSEIFSDIKKIVELFERDTSSFLNKDTVSSNNSDFKTDLTDSFYRILSSFYISDFAQALTFDFINGFLNHQNEILNLDREQVSSSRIFENITEITEPVVNFIEDNFHDEYFLNILSKKLSKISAKSGLIHSDINDAYKLSNKDFYKNFNIFKKQKLLKLEKVNNLGKRIKFNQNSNLFLSNKKDYLNSNFKTFVLDTNSSKRMQKNSLIKIKVSIVDKLNVNRLYLPKVYLFSPMITNSDYLTNTVLKNNGISNINNNRTAFFDDSLSILNRITIENNSKALDENIIDLKSTIKSKFNNLDLEEVSALYKYILECHESSFEISNILKYCYDIDMSLIENNNSISKEVYEIVSKLNEKQFFDVFNFDKKLALNMIKFDSDLERYILPIRSEVLESNCQVFDLLAEIESMCSFSILDDIINLEYYDLYNIAINPKSFFYIDVSSNDVNIDEVKLLGEDINELDEIFSKINNLDNFTTYNSTFKKSNLEIDNFSIVFETEII
jgi:hypothetical protein